MRLVALIWLAREQGLSGNLQQPPATENYARGAKGPAIHKLLIYVLMSSAMLALRPLQELVQTISASPKRLLEWTWTTLKQLRLPRPSLFVTQQEGF